MLLKKFCGGRLAVVLALLLSQYGHLTLADAGVSLVSALPVMAGMALGVGAAFALGFFDGVVKPISIRQRAEIKYVGEIGAGDFQAIGGCAGGDEKLIEGDFLAIIERDHATGSVEK